MKAQKSLLLIFSLAGLLLLMARFGAFEWQQPTAVGPSNGSVMTTTTRRNPTPTRQPDISDAYRTAVDYLMTWHAELQADVDYLAVDTSQFTAVTALEKAKLLAEFEQYHLKVLDKTFVDLQAEGLIRNAVFENGILIEIKNVRIDGLTLTVDGMKFRSGVAAFGMKDLQFSWQNQRWTVSGPRETWSPEP